MEEEESVFFVCIKDPVELRRYILEIARESIQTLQLFENLRGMRDEKMKSVTGLRSNLREITRLLSKLKNSLPQAKLRVKLHERETLAGEGAGAKKKEKKKAGKTEVKGMAVEKQASSALEKLEDELSAIEEKLGSLD